MPKSDASFNLQNYAPVADRIRLFYESFPEGRITTELVSRTSVEVTFKALVFRDAATAHPAATGWASEREGDGDVNSVACLENTETSAIGRALANLGFTASLRRPSREEMEKAERARQRPLVATSVPAHARIGAPVPRPTRTRVREPKRDADADARADIALDLLDLIGTAERRGFSDGRATLLRAAVAGTTAQHPHAAARMRRIEARLRAWLRRRDE